MRITFQTGADKGTDITIHSTPAEDAALGKDSGLLAGWLVTALTGLVALRTGRLDNGQPLTPESWHGVINDLHARLVPRLEAIRDAAIRAHADAGGSYGDLALAMDVARSTAQSRREAVTSRNPSSWEDWACHGGPQPSSQPSSQHWPAEVTFDFRPRSSPVQRITVPAATAEMYAQLVAAAEGTVSDDAIFFLDSYSAGETTPRRLMYRAGRIANVRITR